MTDFLESGEKPIILALGAMSFEDKEECNGNTCNTYEGTFRGSQNEYDCNRGYVQGKKDMNNASGEN